MTRVHYAWTPSPDKRVAGYFLRVDVVRYDCGHATNWTTTNAIGSTVSWCLTSYYQEMATDPKLESRSSATNQLVAEPPVAPPPTLTLTWKGPLWQSSNLKAWLAVTNPSPLNIQCSNAPELFWRGSNISLTRLPRPD